MNEELLRKIMDQFEELKHKYSTEDGEGSTMDLESIISESVDELQEELQRDSMKVLLEYQKVSEDAVSPSYAYETDSGFDLCSTEEVLLEPSGRALVPTGLKIKIPERFEIQVRPKSGLALKQGLTVLNTPGTIDLGYTGEIKVIVFNTNKTEFKIEKGMKIAQAVLSPVMCGTFVKLKQVNNIENKDRGENGFGSTGINLFK
jgi:dUTP pyrophosphatase